MALAIDVEEAVRRLEGAVRLARDESFPVSELWLDRIADLEAWKGNKLALTAFATATLAKATDPNVDPLSLIDRSGDPRSYNARLFARDVLVPNARRLGFLLGTAGPDPLAGSPWFGPERIDEISKWRPNAKQHADNLVGWLAGITSDEANAALVAFVLRRSEAQQRQVEERKDALVSTGSDVSLPEIADALDRFMGRNPEEGRRGAAAAAAAFSAVGRQVVTRPINDPGQIDVDVMGGDGLLLIGIEVKQRPATEQDALDIAAGAHSQGATRAILCAFGQGALRLPDAQIIDAADVDFGVVLHVVYSARELIRIAVMTGESGRPTVLRRLPGDFSTHLNALGGSVEALEQWKSVVASWSRRKG